MSATDLNPVHKANAKAENERTRKLLLQSIALLGFVSLVFSALPELDLIVSRFFWEPAAGFAFNDNRFLIAFRDTNRILPWVIIGIAIPFLVPNPFLKYLRFPPAPHKILFMLTFFALGPGLGVHLLKILVGRARPRALDEFGGNAVFTPPWELSDQCARNCSFISGEAASAFALLTLVVFIRPNYRTVFLIGAGIIAAAFSFNRVVFGAHFLSDTMISWNLMLILAILLWRSFSRNAAQIDALFHRQ